MEPYLSVRFAAGILLERLNSGFELLSVRVFSPFSGSDCEKFKPVLVWIGHFLYLPLATLFELGSVGIAWSVEACAMSNCRDGGSGAGLLAAASCALSSISWKVSVAVPPDPDCCLICWRCCSSSLSVSDSSKLLWHHWSASAWIRWFAFSWSVLACRPTSAKLQLSESVSIGCSAPSVLVVSVIPVATVITAFSAFGWVAVASFVSSLCPPGFYLSLFVGCPHLWSCPYLWVLVPVCFLTALSWPVSPQVS